jgi:hypothetical protein
MTQASLSFSLVLKWLMSICVLFAVLSLKLRGTLSRVWTSVYFNYALCTLCLCLDMSMLESIIIYP